MSVCTFVWAEDGVTWYCTLDNGHDGMHGAGTLGDEILRWCPRDDAAPRVWSLPPEPGPEVTAVRDQLKDRFVRMNGGWQMAGHETCCADYVRQWEDLRFPLTDATETGADQ